MGTKRPESKPDFVACQIQDQSQLVAYFILKAMEDRGEPLEVETDDGMVVEVPARVVIESFVAHMNEGQ